MNRRTIAFVLAAVVLIVPALAFASAKATGIVPCDGPDCRACDFVQLGQNILKFFIDAMVLIIALVFAIGGLKMVLAGGNEGQISTAKSMMTNSIIGFVILLSSYLIIDTILKTFVTGADLGPWNEVECISPPVVEGPATTTPPGECSVADLSPITDPAASQMEAMNGAAVIWAGTDSRLQPCVNKFTGKVGGTVTSAYRPQSYQTHLFEIKQRWCDMGLKTNTDEICASVKEHVSGEVQKHFGGSWNCGAVAQQNSSHSTGIAVDISGVNNALPSVRQAAQESCLSWANLPNDPYHYTLRQGCSCS